MSPSLIAFLIYRAMAFVTGTFIIYLGYLLFLKGIFTSAGDMDGNMGANKVTLKNAAPGTFFALFGALVILLSIFTAHYDSDITKENSSLNKHIVVKTNASKDSSDVNIKLPVTDKKQYPNTTTSVDSQHIFFHGVDVFGIKQDDPNQSENINL